MAQVAERKATYEDLRAVAPHLVAEILFGKLVTHPRPAPPHAVAAASLTGELVGPFQKGRGGPGGWIFMTEPELHFGEDIAVPELAAWRRERMMEMPANVYVDLAPDWVCEVISRSTEKYDRGDKRLICAEAGVRHLWLVDPRPRLLEAFERVNDKWLLIRTFTGDNDVCVAPFAAITFSLGSLWPFDPPAAQDA